MPGLPAIVAVAFALTLFFTFAFHEVQGLRIEAAFKRLNGLRPGKSKARRRWQRAGQELAEQRRNRMGAFWRSVCHS